MKIKLFDAIKLGFGFYIGYEIAGSLDIKLEKVMNVIKDRIKNGY